MAQNTLSIPQQQIDQERSKAIKEITYWGAVRGKLLRDKITIAAFLLGVFMVAITLGAPWIAENVLGHDPTDVSLRKRNDPPTWAEESWPKFQEFTRSCQGEGVCNWSLWPAMISDSMTGLSECWNAALGECHWLGTDDAGRDVLTRGIYGGAYLAQNRSLCRHGVDDTGCFYGAAQWLLCRHLD